MYVDAKVLAVNTATHTMTVITARIRTTRMLSKSSVVRAVRSTPIGIPVGSNERASESVVSASPLAIVQTRHLLSSTCVTRAYRGVSLFCPYFFRGGEEPTSFDGSDRLDHVCLPTCVSSSSSSYRPHVYMQLCDDEDVPRARRPDLPPRPRHIRDDVSRAWDMFLGEGGSETEVAAGSSGEREGDGAATALTLGTTTCSTCKEGALHVTDGNVVCRHCGAMHARFVDSQAEWRKFASSGGNSGGGHGGASDGGCGWRRSSVASERCGLPVNALLPTISTTSVLSMPGARGGTGGGRWESEEVRRVRRYQQWHAVPYRERSLMCVIDLIQAKSQLYGIPSAIIDDAKHLYKSISERTLSRGENRTGLIASTLYMALKSHGVSRSCKEVADIFGVGVPAVTRGCKRFHAIMGHTMLNSHPVDFLNRFCSNIRLPRSTVARCRSVLEAIVHHGIVSENSPPTICASVIYIVCQKCRDATTRDRPVAKGDVTACCGVSQVSITKCVKKIMQYRHYIEDELGHLISDTTRRP